jgi:predicted ABC-type ATPase
LSKPPVLVVVAGPNGSGKSTFTRSAPPKAPLLDPDAIARLVNPEQPGIAAIEAGRRAATQIRELKRDRQSFAVESTLAGKYALQLMEQAKAGGYRVDLVVIGLEHPALNAERVAARVLRGGHDVPISDIRRRYRRGMMNLPTALSLAHRAMLLDNSSAHDPFRVIMRANRGIVTQIAPALPNWLERAFADHVLALGRSIERKRGDDWPGPNKGAP